MFHTFSLNKSTSAFQVLVAGLAATLFASGLTPNMERQINQPVSQLTASRSTTPQDVTEQFGKPALVLAALVAGSIVVGTALTETRDKGTNMMSTSLSKNQENTILIFNRASRKLQKELLLLLHGDREAAHRLLTQAMLKHPNKTANWYFEKVIYDLERHRRA
ncbi:hypothetical protein [Scytonema sp. NUACC21]